MALENNSEYQIKADNEKYQDTIQMLWGAWQEYMVSESIDFNDITFDGVIINEVVKRYFMDVERIHHYHPDTKLIDCHKIGSYLTYWICKLKPFQVNEKTYEKCKTSKTIFMSNEIIAYYLSLSRINEERNKNKKNDLKEISTDFSQNFLYTLRYRNISPDLLCLIYYQID